VSGPAPVPRPAQRVPAMVRREELISALDEVLKTTPLLDVTIKQVARTAGNCPIGTFYRHFDGLQALATALMETKQAVCREQLTEHIAAIAHLFDVEKRLPAA